MSNKQYNIMAINDKTGFYVQMNATPMTHSEACIMKSKITNYSWRTLLLVEV